MGLFDPAPSSSPASSKPGGLFAPGGPGLFDPKSKAGGGDDLAARVAELEAKLAESGGSSLIRTGTSLGSAILDTLQRPNYAIAGAAEELFSPHGGGAGAAVMRAGREIFSGTYPGIHGDKRGFGEVMERAGVGKGGTIRLNLSPLAGDTEFSLRGTAGLILDIGLDPTTYLGGVGLGRRVATAGGKRVLSSAGEKVFASHVAAEVAKGTAQDIAELGAEAAVSAAVRAGRKELVKEPGIYFAGKVRLAPPIPMPFKSLAQKIGDAVHARGSARRIGEWTQDVESYSASVSHQSETANKAILAVAKQARLSPAALKRVAIAIDEGTIGSLQGAEKDAAEWVAARFKDIADADVKAGLLSSDKVRQDYIAHYYLNDPKEVDKLINQAKGTLPDWTSLGRNGEKRAFDKFAEAEANGLRPLYDPFEALKLRWQNSIEKRNLKDLVERSEVKYGTTPMDPASLVEAGLSASARPSARMAQRAEAILAKGIKKGDVAHLSPQGRQYLFERAIATAPSREALMRLMVDHADEMQKALPSLQGVGMTVAADGSLISTKTFAKSGIKATLPASIFDDISQMDSRLFNSNELNQLARSADLFNSTFKGAVTAWFPAFHFRNAYSNIAQAFTDIGVQALSPALHGKTMQIMFGADGELVTKLGTKYAYFDIRKMMGEMGILASDRNLYEMAESGLRRDAISKANKIVDTVGKPARAVGNTIENEARGMLFTAYLRRGLSPQDATSRVNRVLFDYGAESMTKVEREIFRRAFPFYTWTRKNMELQIRSLAHAPGRLATQGKVFGGRASENQEMTSWEAGALKIRLGRDGRTLDVITGVDLPIRNLDLLWRGTSGKSFLGAIGMLTPPLKVPLETAFGTSAFSGKPLTRTESATAGRFMDAIAPHWFKGFVGYNKVVDAAGRPKYTFDAERFNIMAQSWVLSRMISTSDRQFREYTGDDGTARRMLDVLTGLRPKLLNLDEEQKKRLAERERLLKEASVRSGLGYMGTYYAQEKAKP